MRHRSAPIISILIASCQGGFSHNEQTPTVAEQPYAPYTNLQVLPRETQWPELIDAMLANLQGLGLRQTAGEGCLFCHVGSLETAMEAWDFASDTKPPKRRARIMMRMVREINETHLAQLDDRDSSGTEVTCITCHRGRINPRSLLAQLDMTLGASGIDAVESEYRRLRDQYYGRGVYDFETTLTDLGVRLADRGDYDAAIRTLELNVEVQPQSPDAHRWLIRLVMERGVRERPAEDLRALYDSLISAPRPEETAVWYTLRSVGVRLRRAGDLEAAVRAFALNEQLYEDDHRVITDLALTYLMMGDTTAAVERARRALAISPDYANAIDILDAVQGR